jgi:hypothetical protein
MHFIRFRFESFVLNNNNNNHGESAMQWGLVLVSKFHLAWKNDLAISVVGKMMSTTTTNLNIMYKTKTKYKSGLRFTVYGLHLHSK